MSERRATSLYVAQLTVAGMALSLLIAAGTVSLAGIGLEPPTGEEIKPACDQWLAAGGPLALLVLAAIGLSVLALVRGVRSAWRQITRTRRFLRPRLPGAHAALFGQRVTVFDDHRPDAFCAGYLRPRIYVSRSCLDQLSGPQLRAVIAHERHHLRRRDPLRLFVVRALADALFFIPLLSRMAERYQSLSELAADAAASREADGRGPLAGALLTFEQSAPAPIAGIAPERVDHLLGDAVSTRWRLPVSLTVRGALVLASLGGVFALLWHLAPGAPLPVLVSAACMALMVAVPVAAGVGAVLVSRRALRRRRGE